LYAITAGNDDGIFGMSGDQLVVVDTANLDYESTTGYDLVVSGSDGTESVSVSISIVIININDS
jgi:hypothetical protein